MKIIFLGEDSFSQIVLASIVDAGYEVALVISPLYDSLIHLKLEKYSARMGIDYRRVANFNDATFCRTLRDLKPDLIITAHFEKLLLKEVICIPKLGCINLHPSKLPFYRGMSPQHWPIINGDTRTAVTVHFIDEGIDTGDIIIQKEVIITDEMYVYDLQVKFRSVYKTIMVEAINLILGGGNFVKQKKEVVGSFYGRLKRKDTIINEDMSVMDALRLIRGVSRPYMGAMYEDWIVWKAIPSQNVRELNTNGIFDYNNKKYIAFKDGTLELLDFVMIDKN